MLLQLNVSNYALIEDLSLELCPGLNILSGETGAGKSIIIGALSLLLGERATSDQIRQGEEAALIEAMFAVNPLVLPRISTIMEEAGLTMEEELIISRELSRSGRSVARVNGRAMPVFFLKELGKYLVDLHGQHEHQSLLHPEQHLELLDAFGGDSLAACRQEVADLYSRLKELMRELEALGQDSARRERQMEVLDYQIKEIAAAGLTVEEEEELLRQEKILVHAEKLSTCLLQAYTDLFSGDESSKISPAADRIHAAAQLVDEAALIDSSLSPVVESLQSISTQLQDLSLELKGYIDNLIFDPSELNRIQDRLGLMADLKRKYGSTLEQVIEYGARAESELQRLQNSAELAEQLRPQIAEARQHYGHACAKLTRLRRDAARLLEQRLTQVLGELALDGAQFTVNICPRDQLASRGMDQVEFMFSANPGEPVKPLAKIISGGETSRVMLALKTILARQDQIPTLIFDEIDAGIGGATIQTVAEKLSLLSRHHQVVCVTHSAQIAALADCHYLLYKEIAGERTLTRASLLKTEERRMEIARMLDGAGIDRVSLQHVDQVL
ncbi:MAG TPA: DNA repair protein RecN, partial [Firmicutes bacterium]|nr:DNA repair protein RecN [Bacillota bacterium]